MNDWENIIESWKRSSIKAMDNKCSLFKEQLRGAGGGVQRGAAPGTFYNLPTSKL